MSKPACADCANSLAGHFLPTRNGTSGNRRQRVLSNGIEYHRREVGNTRNLFRASVSKIEKLGLRLRAIYVYDRSGLRIVKVNILQNSTSARSSRTAPWAPLLGIVVLFGLLPCSAQALPQFLVIVKTTYAVKSGGTIDAKRCGICHIDVGGGGAVNPYGKDVKSFLKASSSQTLTSTGLHSLDAKDSDGDGFANIDEFQADTLPGDSLSHPMKKASLSVREVAAEGELSPFDIKAALFAKNAQHPVLVHFPIALFMISLLFDVLGAWKKNPALRTTATYNLIAAAFGGLFAVTTGIIAWQWQYGGAELKGNLRLHLILGVVTTGLLFVLWTVRSQQMKRPNVTAGRVYFVLSLIALVLIALTGHIGGILSGVVQGAQ